MRIEGSAALVTGGASGLGAATAAALAAAGAQVVVADVAEEAGERLAAEIGGRFARTDVTDSAEVVAAVELAGELAPLRVVVSCAGILHGARTIGRDGSYESAYPLDRFERVIAVNLVGTFNVARLGASAMSRNEPLEDGERGVIVNTASVAAYDGQIGQVAYSASKGGIVGMTLPLARDLAVVGVRVNTVAPGLIDTPIYEQAAAPEEMKARLQRDVLFPQRFGLPGEFASLVLELVRNRYLNAEVIRLDAGARLQPR
jgi:NAD(P)-dependent dehydrogenase (short-subunit alcohol dehydrogenase family)